MNRTVTLKSYALVGVTAHVVAVSVTVSDEPSRYVVTETATGRVHGTGAIEQYTRVRGALENCRVPLPAGVSVSVLCAVPLDSLAHLDLPVALGVLLAITDHGPDSLDRMLVAGELSMRGEIRRVRGAVSAARLARDTGLSGIVLPAESADEALVVESADDPIDGFAVYYVEKLKAVSDALQSGRWISDALRRAVLMPQLPGLRSSYGDMIDVRGYQKARAALEIAAAGGHNILLVGPPGIGKTMLARRVPTILPPLSREEQLEVAEVHSAANLYQKHDVTPPYRAPHHTISRSALLGNGQRGLPGEVSLAHRGVLFLDEVHEFDQGALHALRHPVEDGEVALSSEGQSVTLPSSFLLVATATPCPCGWSGSNVRRCVCSDSAVRRHQARLDAISWMFDLAVYMDSEPMQNARQAVADAPVESSAAIRERVVAARVARDETDVEFSPTATAYLETMEIPRLDSVALTIAHIRGHATVRLEDVQEAARFVIR